MTIPRKPTMDDDGSDRAGNYEWFNHYRCPECNTEWSDDWSCQCDDDCPECGCNTSPYESEVNQEYNPSNK